MKDVICLCAQLGAFQSGQSTHVAEIATNGEPPGVEGPLWEVAYLGWVQVSETDGPRVGYQEAHDQPEQGGLACSIGSEEAKD